MCPSEDSVKNKAEFYKKEFNLRDEDFNKMLKRSPALSGYSEDSVKNKVEFYKKEFNLRDEDFNKMLKTLPALSGYSEDSVKNKAEFYKGEFNLSREDFNKMLKSLPTLLCLSDDSVKNKVEFCKKEFNLSREDFNKMLKRLPTLLSLSEDSIKNKAEFYKGEFNLRDEDFNKMLKTSPALLCYSEDSVREKQKQIRDLGISKEVLVNYPNIFSVPVNCLKIRYLILRLVVARAELLSNPRAFITSQNKTYARLAYLSRESKGKVRLVDLMCGEKRFVKKHGVESKQLMEKYKINKEIIEEFKNIVEEEEKIDFTGEEKKFIEREYGGKE